ncbi:MAG: HPr family phosphocarrier protein [Clostridia bacterium]|nr:HPr family phosphocarrier protein [Clostridia bacterium]MBR2327653.1 HPr family phosphocarrier protein [Clostridia bacterium]
MISKKITVEHPYGLHARPATYFIQKANEFKSNIDIMREGRRVNAKSLLGVLSLGVVKGMEITIIANGSDEEAAVDALCDLIINNLESK